MREVVVVLWLVIALAAAFTCLAAWAARRSHRHAPSRGLDQSRHDTFRGVHGGTIGNS